jgi:very-short-patch-repair endonuclease
MNLKGVTKKKFLLLYGKNETIVRWKNYLNLQSKTNTYEYKKEKYGWTENDYIKYNKSRSVTLNNMVKKYGEDLGRKKYRDYCEIRPTFHSKISQELFWKIKTDDCYFAEYNKEFGLNSENGYYFYDYVDSKLKKCIEFNGDYWHCNPKIYTEDYKTHYNYTARDIWKKDEEKINFIRSKEYDVMIVWESEYLQNPDKIIKEVKDFLYDKN